jgi:hypothetical protein
MRPWVDGRAQSRRQSGARMIINPKLRFMLRHQMTFRASHGRGEPLDLISSDKLDVLTLLQEAIEDGQATYVLQNKDQIRLTKAELVPGLALVACLFRRSDPDAAPPFFEDLPTGTIRKADKQPEEAVSVSAHVFISINPVSPNKYEVLIEEISGVSKTYIQYLFLKILREVEYESADEKGRPLRAHTLAELVGHSNDRLGDDASGGQIEFVELLRPAKTEGLDNEGINQQQEKMLLRIDAKNPDKIGVVRRIQNWASQRGWTKLKVRIKLPDDKSRVVPLARDADAADVLFVKAIRVDLNKGLDACTDNISDELMNKASKILRE